MKNKFEGAGDGGRFVEFRNILSELKIDFQNLQHEDLEIIQTRADAILKSGDAPDIKKAIEMAHGSFMDGRGAGSEELEA